MKTLKNLEALFTVAVAIACSASYVSFLQSPAAPAKKTAQASPAMPVVSVTARRLTAQEKQLSLLEERQAQAQARRDNSSAGLL